MERESERERERARERESEIEREKERERERERETASNITSLWSSQDNSRQTITRRARSAGVDRPSQQERIASESGNV